MGVITAIIAAISALAGPAASLFQDVMQIWSDLHVSGSVNIDALTQQAIGAAQAAVQLESDAAAQIKIVVAALTQQNPSAPVAQITAVAAMAVQQQSASPAAASAP